MIVVPTEHRSGETLAASLAAAAMDGYSNTLTLAPLTTSSCAFAERNGFEDCGRTSPRDTAAPRVRSAAMSASVDVTGLGPVRFASSHAAARTSMTTARGSLRITPPRQGPHDRFYGE